MHTLSVVFSDNELSVEIRKISSEVRTFHSVEFAGHYDKFLSKRYIVCGLGCSQTTACISRSRLNKDVPENSLVLKFAVGYAVQRNAPCHTKVHGACQTVCLL